MPKFAAVFLIGTVGNTNFLQINLQMQHPRPCAFGSGGTCSVRKSIITLILSTSKLASSEIPVACQVDFSMFSMNAMTPKRISDQETPKQHFPTTSHCFKDGMYYPSAFTHRNIHKYIKTHFFFFLAKPSIDNIQNEDLKISCKQCGVYGKLS